MEESFLALDFGSGQISAVLTVYDDNTGTCRVRQAARVSCPSISACYILDFDRTVRTLARLLEDICQYASFTPTVVVGLRGEFLSFRRSGSMLPITTKNQIISEREVRAALDASLPANLSEELEVVDLLPQSYTLDGKTGIQTPAGLIGNCLEAETFISCAVRSHITNLNRLLAAVGYEDFEAVPTILSLCDSLLKPEEKRSGVLLLDIGGEHSSAALYHKGMLEGAWELSLGADVMAQDLSDVLQNELSEAKDLLDHYSYGEDEILDDVFDEAATHLLKKIHKELVQSLCYVKYPPHHVVLTGGGTSIPVKNAVKQILGARRVRLALQDDLISDSEEFLAPAYTSGLSLCLYSQHHGERALRPQNNFAKAGFFAKMLAKLGLN